MTVARRGLKVKVILVMVKVMGRAKAVSPTSIEGSFVLVVYANLHSSSSVSLQAVAEGGEYMRILSNSNATVTDGVDRGMACILGVILGSLEGENPSHHRATGSVRFIPIVEETFAAIFVSSAGMNRV